MTRWKSSVFIALLLWPTFGLALLDGSAFGQGVENGLRIVMVQGENSLISISHAPEVIVRLEDGRGKAVSNADVAFSMPSAGASGAFASGSRSVKVKTDGLGLARSGLIRPGAQNGPFEIAIQAAFQGEAAASSARLSNERPIAPDKSSALPARHGRLKSRL